MPVYERFQILRNASISCLLGLSMTCNSKHESGLRVCTCVLLDQPKTWSKSFLKRHVLRKNNMFHLTNLFSFGHNAQSYSNGYFMSNYLHMQQAAITAAYINIILYRRKIRSCDLTWHFYWLSSRPLSRVNGI